VSKRAFDDATQALREGGWNEAYRIGNFNHFQRGRNSQSQSIQHSLVHGEWTFCINGKELMKGTLTQCVKAADSYTEEMDRFLIANQEVPD